MIRYDEIAVFSIISQYHYMNIVRQNNIVWSFIDFDFEFSVWSVALIKYSFYS